MAIPSVPIGKDIQRPEDGAKRPDCIHEVHGIFVVGPNDGIGLGESVVAVGCLCLKDGVKKKQSERNACGKRLAFARIG
jgi:hypothetical protein